MTRVALDNEVTIFELVLMVERWLKKDSYQSDLVLDTQRLACAISYYMDQMHEICKRGGMGMNTVKTHLIQHMPAYIQRWGPPSGWDSGNLE